MADKKREVSSTGRITRVQTKFAYLTSKSFGCVFVPPCAALPDDCSDADMNKYYKTGDIVHFTAIPQAGKNDCAWVATKVVLSTNSETYQGQGGEDPDKPTIITDQLGIVLTVNDTFAFLWSDEYGQVFLPGGAYQPLPDEPPRLSVNLSPNDVLMFTARSQSEHNGCSWLALSAAKYNAHGDYNAPVNSELIEMSALNSGQFFEGYAEVQLVGPTAAVAFCPDHGPVYCPVLTWTGGERDFPGADSLVEVLNQGDRIHFVAVELETEASMQWSCRLRATRWGPTNVPRIVRKMVRDSSAQTFLTADEMLIRGLKKRDPELFDVIRDKFPNLIDYARL